jgi:hypothetical protein
MRPKSVTGDKARRRIAIGCAAAAILLATVIRVVRLEPGPSEGRTAHEAAMRYSIVMSEIPTQPGEERAPEFIYELWDVEGGSAFFGTAKEHEALSLVARALQKFGQSYVENLMLIRVDRDGYPSVVADGPTLVKHARTAPHAN